MVSILDGVRIPPSQSGTDTRLPCWRGIPLQILLRGNSHLQKLEPYYNEPRYRFEVPEQKFEEIQNVLAGHGYALIEVDDPSEFVVVVEKYSDHPEHIFKDSVLQQSDADYNLFLMKDLAAVEQATHDGATRLTETDLVVPF